MPKELNRASAKSLDCDGDRDKSAEGLVVLGVPRCKLIQKGLNSVRLQCLQDYLYFFSHVCQKSAGMECNRLHSQIINHIVFSKLAAAADMTDSAAPTLTVP